MTTVTRLGLRPLLPDDLPQVAAIYRHAVQHTDATLDHEDRSPDAWQDWLAAHEGRYPAVAAEEAGRLAAYGTLSPFSSRTGYLASAEISVYVSPDAQGNGVGSALCERLTAHAERAGMSTVVAFISSDNHMSRRMVQRHGYEHQGTLRRIGYKLGRLVDLDIFQRTFPDNCARFDGAPLDELLRTGAASVAAASPAAPSATAAEDRTPTPSPTAAPHHETQGEQTA